MEEPFFLETFKQMTDYSSFGAHMKEAVKAPHESPCTSMNAQ